MSTLSGRVRRAAPAGIAALALAAVLGACGSPVPSGPPSSGPATAGAAVGGTAASPGAATPSPGSAGSASATAASSPSPVAAGSMPVPGSAARFSLTSPDIEPGAPIPARFTCDGKDRSPALAWTGVPAGTAALVLVVDDPDAGGFVHWLVLDLPAGDVGLPAGVTPSATAPRQGRNDFGTPGWRGPCPPSGTHRYVFTLYALERPLGLRGTPSGDDVRAALGAARVLATATLEAPYART